MYPFMYSFFQLMFQTPIFGSYWSQMGMKLSILLNQIWNFEGYLYNKHLYRNTHTLSTLPRVLANAKQCSNDVEKRKLKLCNIACKWQALMWPCIYQRKLSPRHPNTYWCSVFGDVWGMNQFSAFSYLQPPGVWMPRDPDKSKTWGSSLWNS